METTDTPELQTKTEVKADKPAKAVKPTKSESLPTPTLAATNEPIVETVAPLNLRTKTNTVDIGSGPWKCMVDSRPDLGLVLEIKKVGVLIMVGENVQFIPGTKLSDNKSGGYDIVTVV